MTIRIAGRLIDSLPAAARTRIRSAVGRPGIREIRIDQLEAELADVAPLMAASPEDAHAYLAGLRVAASTQPPSDPFSAPYAAWTWDLYRRLSGRTTYDAHREASHVDLEAAIQCPFPYQTGSLALVGRDLAARANLLNCLATLIPQPVSRRRVVEFGPGWGGLTHDLVATGLDVTAVEIDPQFCTLVRDRCTGSGRLTVVNTDMLSFDGDSFDAALFFESFHHCSDHLAMLARLHRLLRPGGVVLFAAEPIHKLTFPWGPRLDGLSVWSTRTYGWLELGFDSRYFARALDRTGWRAERRTLGTRSDETDVLVARRA